MIEELLNGVSKLTQTAQQVTDDVSLLRFTIVNACIEAVGQNEAGSIYDTASF